VERRQVAHLPQADAVLALPIEAHASVRRGDVQDLHRVERHARPPGGERLALAILPGAQEVLVDPGELRPERVDLLAELRHLARAQHGARPDRRAGVDAPVAVEAAVAQGVEEREEVTLQPAAVAAPGRGGSWPDSRDVRTASTTAATGLWPR